MVMQARKEEVEDTQWEIVQVDNKLCKGCGICVHYCPKEVLALKEGKAQVVAPEKCNACGLCVLRCPDFAVKLQD